MNLKNHLGRRFLCLLLFVPVTAALLSTAACSSGSMTISDGLNLPSELAFYQAPPAALKLPATSGKAPRNIILMIGDGMGPAQVEMARRAAVAQNGQLWMESLPVTASVRTDNAGGNTTDSAAASTAVACAVKTKNGMIGQAPDGRTWLNIRERLELEGYNTGVVATSSVTHATPAGFTAHVASRGMENEIAEQQAQGSTDLLLGGGQKYWDRPRTRQHLERTGFQLVTTRDELDAADTLPLLGLFQPKEMTTLEPNEPSIEEMTAAALRLLSAPGPDGTKAPFFLMVEGSQIDWAGHANDTHYCIRQTLLFDMAVRAALDFARRDGNTLVIVTADHETGGLIVEPSADDPKILDYRWTTGGHTSADVPLFAFGPGAKAFAGTLDLADISKTIAALLNLDGFPRPLAPADRQAPVLQTATP